MESPVKCAVIGSLIFFIVITGFFVARGVGSESKIGGFMQGLGWGSDEYRVDLQGKSAGNVMEDGVYFTSNTRTEIVGRKSKLFFYPYDRFMFDENKGRDTNITDYFNVTFEDGLLVVKTPEFTQEFKLGVRTKSQGDTDFSNLKTNLDFDSNVFIRKEPHKYEFDFVATGIPEAVKNDLECFYIKKVPSEVNTKADGEKLEMGSKLKMEFYGAKSQTFTIDSVTKDETLICNLTANTKQGKLIVDPTITIIGDGTWTNIETNWISSGQPTTSHGGERAGSDVFYLGNHGAAGRYYRGLLRFSNLTETIPSGSVIDNVTMNVSTIGTPQATCDGAGAADGTLNLYISKYLWSGENATWNTYNGGDNWVGAAGATGVADTEEWLCDQEDWNGSIYNNTVSFSSHVLTSYVQDMANTSGSNVNYGFVINTTEGMGGTSKIFCGNPGRSGVGFANMPLIVVEYTIPPTAPTTPTWNRPAANGTTIQSYSYAVNWTNSTDPQEDSLTYILEVSNEIDFSNMTYRNTSITETATPTGDTLTMLPAGNIYARVRANDGTENSSWSSTWWIQGSNNLSVSLSVPADSLNSTVAGIVFNCSALDSDDLLVNISLIIDDVVNYTKTESNHNLSLQRNVTLTEVDHTWTCNATNVKGETATFAKRSFTIDPVELDLVQPTDNLNSSTANVNFSCVGNSTADILNITLWIDGFVNYTHIGTGLTKETLNTSVILPGPAHNWTCIAYDVNGFNETATTQDFRIDPITLDLDVPAADFNSSTANMTFKCTGNSTAEISKVDLWIDGFLNYTHTGTGLTIETLNTSIVLSGHSHNWTCIAYDVNGYNDTATTRDFSIDPVELDLVRPANNLNSTEANINFNCIGNSTAEILNITLWIDGFANYTHAGTGLTRETLNTTQTLTGSVHNWTCIAYDVNGYSETATTWDFIIDPVELDLNVPADLANFTSNDVEFNCTANSTAYLHNITLIIDGVHNYTLDVSSETTKSLKVNRTLTEGDHSWSCLAYDVNLFNETATTRTFGIDSIVPVIGITNYNTSLITYSVPINMTVNWTVTDDNIADTWISYNGSNHTGVGSGGNYGLRFGLNGSLTQSFYIYANDTYGTLNRTQIDTTVHHITYALYESQETVMEGSQVTFTLYVNKTSIPSTTAILMWNNTNYGFGVRTLTGTQSYKFTKSLTVPVGTGNSSGNLIKYYWNYSMLGVKNDSLTENLTVMSVNIGINCTLYPKLILNFTLVDQDTRHSEDIANGTIEVTANIYSLDNSVNFTLSQNFTGTNARVCISNFTEGSNLKMSTVTKYLADDHFTQYHYLQDYDLSYSTLEQQVILYDLLTSRGTAFVVTYKDENSLPVGNAIIDLTRYYAGLGSYLSVEHGRTNNYGETVLHFVENSEIYKLIARKNNEIDYTTPDPSHATCQVVPCKFNIRKTADTITAGAFSEINNLEYNLSFDKTSRTVTLIYSTNNGLVTEIGLNTTLFDSYGNATICADTDSSNSGTLTCTIPDSYQNTSYMVVIYKDGVAEVYKLFSLTEELKDREEYKGTVIFMSFLIFLTLVLMFASDMVLSIIMGMTALILSTVMLLLSGGSVIGYSSFSIVLVVAACVVAWKINNRR